MIKDLMRDIVDDVIIDDRLSREEQDALCDKYNEILREERFHLRLETIASILCLLYDRDIKRLKSDIAMLMFMGTGNRQVSNREVMSVLLEHIRLYLKDNFAGLINELNDLERAIEEQDFEEDELPFM